MTRRIAALVIVIGIAALWGSTGGGQAAPPKDIGQLISTLEDQGLTTLQKNGLVDQVYAGVVEVSDVTEAGVLQPTRPGIIIEVEPGILNKNWFLRG